MRHRHPLLAALLPVGGLLVAAAVPARAVVPAGFTDALVTSVGAVATSVAFTPDGRMLISTQGGDLRVFQNGSLIVTPALDFAAADICTSSEQGLLGIAVHPQFATNNFIYLYYTAETPTCVNRVSRFTLPPGNVIDPDSELVLVDNMPSPGGNHNAGDVHFGRDGFLYITIGDGGCDWAGNSGCAGSNDAARDEHVLTGKVLRITDDGNIPASNPFQGAGTARCNVTGMTTPGNRCQETFAWGLRNPFRFAFDPNDAGTRFFINDVGQGLWEEIDVGQSGADYGWNVCEGAHDNGQTDPDCDNALPGMVGPFFNYRHGVIIPGTTSPTNCNSITGGAFVPNGVWPAAYDGTYLFGDVVCGFMGRIDADGAPPASATDFGSALGGVVHLRFGPFGNTQALYYTTTGGSVRRVSFNNAGGNNPPTAEAAASPLGGSLPLLVTFDATGSSDPDAGNTLTYFWDFGDGSPVESTTNLTIQHTYTAAGVFTASLQARDNLLAFSVPATVEVQPGNHLPVPVIDAPLAAAVFGVGDNVVLQGHATDSDGDTTTLLWNVLRHHNGDHAHPFVTDEPGNNVPFVTPAPEELAATGTGNHLEILLTATDEHGLSNTVSQLFQPDRVQVTLASAPAGQDLIFDPPTDPPLEQTAPFAVTSWRGWQVQISAPHQNGLLFSTWSDGGAQTHDVVTPADDITYTASFVVPSEVGPLDYFTVTPCRVVDTRAAPDAPALQPGTPRTFTIVGDCAVPVGAAAVILNVTAVSPSAGGHLQMRGSDQPPTDTSVLNFVAGITRANNATVRLGADGALVVTANGAGTHLVIDVVGYYEGD